MVQPFEASTDMAIALAKIIQRELMRRELAADEQDTTIADYVSMMVGDGDTSREQIAQETADFTQMDLETSKEFVEWTYGQAAKLQGIEEPSMEAEGQAVVPVEDDTAMETDAGEPRSIEQMHRDHQDAPDDLYVCPACVNEIPFEISNEIVKIGKYSTDQQICFCDVFRIWKWLTHGDRRLPKGAPVGPKAMHRGPGSGMENSRGKRVMTQLRQHMDRSAPASIPAHRISSGRVDTKRGRQPPRGPVSRGPNTNLARGVGRMMNMPRGQLNQMMQPGPQLNMNGANQLQMAQFMETATALMAQMAGQQQQQTVYNPNFRGGRGGPRGGRGMTRGGRGGSRGGAHTNGHANGDDAMDISLDTPLSGSNTNGGNLFDTECRFNSHCTNASCPYAHQSPAATSKTVLDLSDTCPQKAACQNFKCSAKHPSPALRNQHNGTQPNIPTTSTFAGPKSTVKCRFDTHCTRDGCPFQHSTIPPCKNGPDCDVRGCKFTHSEIACRFDPCTKAGMCTFKHRPGQRQEGGFKDKVWKAEGGTADRMQGFKSEGAEELILPGGQNVMEGNNVGPAEGMVGNQVSSQDMETQIVT